MASYVVMRSGCLGATIIDMHDGLTNLDKQGIVALSPILFPTVFIMNVGSPNSSDCVESISCVVAG